MTKQNTAARTMAIEEMTGGIAPRITLKARKVRIIKSYASICKTELYSSDGTLKLTIPAIAKQPLRGSKTITLTGIIYNLEWVD